VYGFGFIPPKAGQRSKERNVAPLLRSERCEKYYKPGNTDAWIDLSGYKAL
jgi:hypothetical protein